MSGKQVPDRMLAHAARAKGACDDFSVCRALWFFHAMKEHDRTTTKRIQDNRLRVSLLKNTKILIPVHILSQEVFPQLLQVSRLFHVNQHVNRPIFGK